MCLSFSALTACWYDELLQFLSWFHPYDRLWLGIVIQMNPSSLSCYCQDISVGTHGREPSPKPWQTHSLIIVIIKLLWHNPYWLNHNWIFFFFFGKPSFVRFILRSKLIISTFKTVWRGGYRSQGWKQPFVTAADLAACVIPVTLKFFCLFLKPDWFRCIHSFFGHRILHIHCCIWANV